MTPRSLSAASGITAPTTATGPASTPATGLGADPVLIGREAPPSDPRAREQWLVRSLAAMPASLFQFDPRMAEGWYSDRYFLRTAATLAHDGRDPIVRMQLFAKHTGVLGGVYETLRMLETQLAMNPQTGCPYSLRECEIETLLDGDAITPWEPVMHIVGPYRAFAHLETPYLGVLARRTLVASNVARVTAAARGKPVILMGARHDDWRIQTPDGYAARLTGVADVSSHAGGEWWGGAGVGTMPHALIACFRGDVVAATRAFTRYCRDVEPEVKVVSLVDYQNNVVEDAVRVAEAMARDFGSGALWGIRLDTGERMMDRWLEQHRTDVEAEYPGERLTGVSRPLVVATRRALDRAGHPDVQIGVSGGFTPARIARFEDAGVPVDFYGVGSSLLGHNKGDADGLLTGFDFTADIVTVDGAREHKVGRERRDNARFVKLDVTRYAP